MFQRGYHPARISDVSPGAGVLRLSRSANLTGANFSGQDLSGLLFVGAVLQGANLSRCILGADFTDADLTGANLRGATGFDETEFSGAIIDDVKGLSAENRELLEELV